MVMRALGRAIHEQTHLLCQWDFVKNKQPEGLDCMFGVIHGAGLHQAVHDVGLESSKQALTIRDGEDEGGCCPAETQALGTCWHARALTRSWV